MINFKKEMAYTSKRKRELLSKGIYKGYKWYILNLGTHPCGYIDLGDYNVTQDEENIIPVHGGITYHKTSLDIGAGQIVGTNIIGWDYAHYNDYIGYFSDICSLTDDMKLHKWTTDEIIEDVKFAIDFICIVKGDDNYGNR